MVIQQTTSKSSFQKLCSSMHSNLFLRLRTNLDENVMVQCVAQLQLLTTLQLYRAEGGSENGGRTSKNISCIVTDFLLFFPKSGEGMPCALLVEIGFYAYISQKSRCNIEIKKSFFMKFQCFSNVLANPKSICFTQMIDSINA